MTFHVCCFLVFEEPLRPSLLVLVDPAPESQRLCWDYEGALEFVLVIFVNVNIIACISHSNGVSIGMFVL